MHIFFKKGFFLFTIRFIFCDYLFIFQIWYQVWVTYLGKEKQKTTIIYTCQRDYGVSGLSE